MNTIMDISRQLNKGDLIILIDDFGSFSGYLLGLAGTGTEHHVKLSSTSSEFTYLCRILNLQGNIGILREVVDISKEFSIPSIKISEVYKSLYDRSICTLSGQVIHGQKLGRKLGYPTANLDLFTTNECLRNGVYGVKVNWREQTYLGIMNAGVKPTINNYMKMSYEIHILDFTHDIYEETLNVEVKFFIREEKKFNKVNQLIQQIENDIQKVKNIFKSQLAVKIG